MIGKHNRSLRGIKTKYFFAILAIVVVGLSGLSRLSQSGASSDETDFDPSKIKVSARPPESAVDSTSEVDKAKEAKVEAEARAPDNTSASKSVCLDPGHGGIDPGATKGKIQESDINLIVAQKVQALLEAQGYPVYLTRTTNNESLSKKDRYSFCNDKNASILIAVHHNTYTSGSVNYTTALYYSEHDQLLAQSIAQSVSAALRLESKGIAWFDNSVLSKSKMPAVFSEAFFMTNNAEYAKLVKKDYSRLDKEAQGIVDGIINYFADPSQFKPSFAAEELKIDRADW